MQVYVPGALGAIGAGMAAGMLDKGVCGTLGSDSTVPATVGAEAAGEGVGFARLCAGAENTGFV